MSTPSVRCRYCYDTGIDCNTYGQFHCFCVAGNNVPDDHPDLGGHKPTRHDPHAAQLAENADPAIEDALQYADGLPADCWADRCIINLAAEVVQLRKQHAETVRLLEEALPYICAIDIAKLIRAHLAALKQTAK